MIHFSTFDVDSRVRRQARALADRGDEVHCVGLGRPQRLEVGEGSIELHPVHCRKGRSGAADYLIGYARFFLAALRTVTALDRRHRFDLVEAHNMPNLLAFAAIRARLRGARVILDVHDTFPELFATKFGLGEGHPVSRLLRLEERASSAFADATMLVTAEAGELLNSRGTGTRRSAVVMNAPDERVFGPPRPPVDLPTEGPLRLVYHGGVAPRFGVETAIRAVARLRAEASDVRLSVYGASDDGDAVRALAVELTPDDVWCAPEPVPFLDIPAVLAQHHVGIVPTLRDQFTELLLPVKLMEYIHMGLPVICSRLSTIRRYFTDEHLWFYEPGSGASLAATLADLRARPEEAAARARNATARLAEFGWTRQRETYLGLVDELTGRHDAQAA